jgi:hypothetical protein
MFPDAAGKKVQLSDESKTKNRSIIKEGRLDVPSLDPLLYLG